MSLPTIFMKAAILLVASLVFSREEQSAFADAPQLPFDMTKPALDVGLVITDEAKSKDFYTGVLGIKQLPGALPMPEGGKMLRFQAGPTTIKMLLYPQAPPAYPGGINNTIGFRLLTLYLPDLDQIAGNAVAHGLERPSIMGAKGSGRLIFMNDPDNNQLELLEVAQPQGTTAPDPTDRFTIGLTVKDAEKSREFYGKTLGLEELESMRLFKTSGPMKYTFRVGKSTIKFWQFDRELPAHTGPWKDAVGLRYFTFMVKSVDAAYETLKSRGAKIMMPPQVFGGLAYIMLVADPDGNTIEFAQIGKPK